MSKNNFLTITVGLFFYMVINTLSVLIFPFFEAFLGGVMIGCLTIGAFTWCFTLNKKHRNIYDQPRTRAIYIRAATGKAWIAIFLAIWSTTPLSETLFSEEALFFGGVLWILGILTVLSIAKSLRNMPAE